MKIVKTTVFCSDLGWMGVAWTGRCLLELTFGHSSPGIAAKRLTHADSIPAEPDALMGALIRRLQAYARGECGDDFRDVTLDLADKTAFQRAVIHHCRRIPAGETLTYGELAARAGYPGAARAVGQVMATNRVPLVVPCHRVVAANGRLGGYSAPGGLALKLRLLAAEGIHGEQLRHKEPG